MQSKSDQNARVLDQFSQQAGAYANLVNQTAGASLEPMIEALAPGATDRVLDVGCGTGQFVVAIAPFAAEVVGADLTPAMLEQGRTLQAQTRLTNIKWLQSDSSALPVDDASFDIVTSRSMLHHAADPAATLSEMRRACKPGGRIGVLDLTPSPAKAPAFDAIELLRDPSHARILSAEELRTLGAELGLEEILVRTRATELPLEKTLATSFPPPGILERVRDLYARDAATGADAFGLQARLKEGQVWVTYPMTMIIWRRP